MASLSIRNLPEELHRQLRLRAARQGRSMEAEARAILAEALQQPEPVMPPEALQRWVADLVRTAPVVGMVDELLAERRREAEGEAGHGGA